MGLVLFGPLDPFPRQTDLSFVRVDAQDLYLDLLADLHHLFRVFHLVVGQFRNVQQTLQAVLQADEHTEIGDLRHGTPNDLAGLVLIGNVVRPRILVHLLQAQSDPPSRLIHRQHAAAHFLTLLEHFVRVTDLPRPRHV